MAKNYYTILGILPSATSEDIRGAYRKRAKELHPDHYGENSSPFLEVQEAYGVLSDPRHRQKYDRSLQNPLMRGIPMLHAEAEPLRQGRSGVEPLRSPGRRADFGEIYLDSFRTSRPSFEEILDRLWSNFDPAQSRKSESVRNLSLEIVLSPEEARLGGRMMIVLPSRVSCPVCGGSGGIDLYECYRCAGRGAIYGETPVAVEIPPGIPDGSRRTISLARLGIRDVYVSLLFLISRRAPVEDL